MNNLIFYQKNRDVILNRAKDCYENDKERLWEQARDKYINFFEEDENKKMNMEKTDIIICLKKKNKNLKNIKTFMAGQKRLNIIINKISF